MNALTISRVLCGITLALLAGALPLTAAHAQENAATGTVCVAAYNDTNRNNVRDPGEEALADVNFSLMIASNVVVANYVALRGEAYCFENLPAQQYTLSADSPLYLPVNAAPVTFTLAAGTRQIYEFGAVPRPLDGFVPASDTIINIPLTVPVRIGLSLAGALAVMAVFSAAGLMIYGIFLHRRPSSEPQPARNRPARAARAGKRLQMASPSGRSRATREFETFQAPRSERYGDAEGDSGDSL